MSNCTTCGGILGDSLDLSMSGSPCGCPSSMDIYNPLQNDTDCCSVSSVNGQTGDVNITLQDLLGGTTLITSSDVLQILYNNFYTPAQQITINNSTHVIGHSNSGVTAGTYGSASVIPQITVNAQGHVTGVTGVTPERPFVLSGDPSVVLPTGIPVLPVVVNTGGPIAPGGVVSVKPTQLVPATGDVTVTPVAATLTEPAKIVVANTVINDLAGTYGSLTTFPKIEVNRVGKVIAAESIALPAGNVNQTEVYFLDTKEFSNATGEGESSVTLLPFTFLTPDNPRTEGGLLHLEIEAIIKIKNTVNLPELRALNITIDGCNIVSVSVAAGVNPSTSPYVVCRGTFTQDIANPNRFISGGRFVAITNINDVKERLDCNIYEPTASSIEIASALWCEVSLVVKKHILPGGRIITQA